VKCNDALGRYLHRTTPELQFRMNATIACEMRRLNMECAAWRMVADLFTYDPQTKIRSRTKFLKKNITHTMMYKMSNDAHHTVSDQN